MDMIPLPPRFLEAVAVYFGAAISVLLAAWFFRRRAVATVDRINHCVTVERAKWRGEMERVEQQVETLKASNARQRSELELYHELPTDVQQLRQELADVNTINQQLCDTLQASGQRIKELERQVLQQEGFYAEDEDTPSPTLDQLANSWSTLIESKEVS